MNFRKSVIILLYYVSLLRLQTMALFWNWVVTNPHVSSDDPISTSKLNVRQDPIPLTFSSDEDEDRLKTGHSRVQRERIFPGSAGTVESYPEGSSHHGRVRGERARLENENHRCFKDKDCNDSSMFCDRHYHSCRNRRSEGQACRADSHCATDLHCMFGKCTESIQPGERGSRCNSDKDCGQNFCCARQHGEKICKAKLKLGDLCYVPEGGLSYSLNEQCPCESNLICDFLVSSDSERRNGQLWSKNWRDRNKLRCIRPAN